MAGLYYQLTFYHLLILRNLFFLCFVVSCRKYNPSFCVKLRVFRQLLYVKYMFVSASNFLLHSPRSLDQFCPMMHSVLLFFGIFESETSWIKNTVFFYAAQNKLNTTVITEFIHVYKAGHMTEKVLIATFSVSNTAMQARNQLGTPGGAKSFLRRAQIFNYVQHIFPGGLKLVLVTGLWQCSMCYGRKARVACARSFTLWQQATVVSSHAAITLLLLVRATYIYGCCSSRTFRSNRAFSATPAERLKQMLETTHSFLRIGKKIKSFTAAKRTYWRNLREGIWYQLSGA